MQQIANDGVPSLNGSAMTRGGDTIVAINGLPGKMRRVDRTSVNWPGSVCAGWDWALVRWGDSPWLWRPWRRRWTSLEETPRELAWCQSLSSRDSLLHPGRTSLAGSSGTCLDRSSQSLAQRLYTPTGRHTLHKISWHIINYVACVRSFYYCNPLTPTHHSSLSSLSKSCYSHIRELRCIRPYLDSKTASTIAASIVHSELDYCNSLCYNLKSQINRLQQIQNCLARTVVKAPKSSHITPILRSLHWIKINERIKYKLLSLTYKVLTTSQPDYLHNLISVQSTDRTHSSSLVTLTRPSVSSSLQITNRSFTYASPYLWNQLPSSFHQPHSVHSLPGLPHPAHITSSQSPPSLSSPITASTFHSRLKTHPFHKCYSP